MQISAGQDIFLIDTLKLNCPPIIKKLLADPSITKIFQDMQYDLALLKYNQNCHTVNVFDISLADRLVRQSNNNRKLSKIVEDYLGIISKIPNKSQKSNWGSRPLSDKQTEYAAYDVMYLVDIYHYFENKLDGSFIHSCMQEYLTKYTPRDYRRKYNINSMWKTKQIDSLSQEELFRFRNLLLARDKIARKQNRPLFWICNEAVLRDLARTNYSEEEEIRTFLLKNNSFNRYVRKGIKYILNAYNETNNNQEALEPPEYGVSLKTWIPINNPRKKDYYPDPEMVLTIKEWQNEVISNLKLIPEFIKEKGQTGYIASLKPSDWHKEIDFPGIPDRVRSQFIDDLVQFIKSGRSKLKTKSLLEINT